MEVENHDYALASSNISKPFRVFFADDERTLQFGDAPVARKLLDIRADEADRPQLNAHTENPPVRPGSCSLHLTVEHTARLRQSNRRRASASLPSAPAEPPASAVASFDQRRPRTKPSGLPRARRTRSRTSSQRPP